MQLNVLTKDLDINASAKWDLQEKIVKMVIVFYIIAAACNTDCATFEIRLKTDAVADFVKTLICLFANFVIFRCLAKARIYMCIYVLSF